MRRKGNARGRATRELILVTAERLFAEHGLHAVSVREISAAAEQRNNAAIDYHFGNRADLITAIYTYRAQSVNRRCAELLAELDAHGSPDTVAALLRVQLLPHVENLADPDHHFVQFLARAFTETTRLAVTSSESGRVLLPAVFEARDRLRHLLPELDDDDFGRRTRVIANWSIQRIAEFAREQRGATADEANAMLSDLIAMLEGALRAPVAR